MIFKEGKCRAKDRISYDLKGGKIQGTNGEIPLKDRQR